MQRVEYSRCVLIDAQTGQVGSRYHGRVPNERLTTVVVTTRTIGVVFVRPIRSHPRPMLHLPKLKDPNVRVQGIVAKLVTVCVPSRRACFDGVFVLFMVFTKGYR